MFSFLLSHCDTKAVGRERLLVWELEGASNLGCFRHYSPIADKIKEFLDSYLLFNLSLKSNLCHLDIGVDLC